MNTRTCTKVAALGGGLVVVLLYAFVATAYASTLRVAPDTGVYNAGETFTVRVAIDTDGQSVNAAEGRLSFNTRELSVVGLSRASSIFNLWTEDPTFSNAAGTISFGGGSPNGYVGNGGTVLTITFRALNSGNPRVTFVSGSVLAADGFGTNILTAMTGGSYTITAREENPEPEYIAPANTPAAPEITSPSHPDPDSWYATTTATLAWTVPDGVVAVRTLLDENPVTIPTIVYEDPITSRTVEDLPQGTSYFHVQFRNSEGWGKINHYRLGVDTEPPEDFVIQEEEESDTISPKRTLRFDFIETSPVTLYRIQLDGGEPTEYTDEEETRLYTLPLLPPNHHTVIVEAVDAADNSSVATYAFDITSFEKPVFIEYPDRVSNAVIPALKGKTKPNAAVAIEVRGRNAESVQYTTKSDEDGEFIFIPDAPLSLGVYDVVAVATDENGAQSEPSDPIRIVVEEPGFVRIGSVAVSVLSVLIPFVALLVFLMFGLWYLWHRLIVWKRRILKETQEAEYRLAVEFDAITSHLADRVNKLKKSRKGKLTQAEDLLIREMKKDIDRARDRIHKEISDIDDVVE